MSLRGWFDSDDLDFLPDVEAAVRRRGHRFAYVLSLMVFLFFVCFVVWAGLAVVDEVTRGDATVVPSSRVQVIQNLEGGILAEIRVREGDIVEKDDILVRIDNSSATASFRDLTGQRLTLMAAVARLEAELAGADIAFPAEVLEEAPEAAADEQALHEARRAQLAAQTSVLDAQASQRQQEIREMQAQRQQVARSLELARQELKITEPMVEKKLMPKVDLLRVQRQIAELEGEAKTIAIAIPRLETALREAEQRVAELTLSQRTKVSEELKQAKSDLKSTSEMLSAGADRVTRTDVRSPVRGTVKQIMVNTLGGVIRPGADIMEIVPLDDSLLIEARIRPADIAFLHAGQAATVKITAYDFSIYGGLKATLESISADTIKDDRGESFYRVFLRTAQGSLTHRGGELPIIPGMTASAEILTGGKTVLAYLLKPILKARERALSER